MKFSNLKIKKVRKSFGEGESLVEIYNITEENKDAINKIIIESMEKDNIQIDGATIIVKLLPLLTNIELDYDITNSEHKLIVDDIVAHPSQLLEEVTEEIDKILKEQLNKINKGIDRLKDLSDEEIAKIMEENKIETDEEKALRLEQEEKERKKAELLKQLEELEK